MARIAGPSICSSEHLHRIRRFARVAIASSMRRSWRLRRYHDSRRLVSRHRCSLVTRWRTKHGLRRDWGRSVSAARTPEEAIRGYTAWAARSSFTDADAGALRVGAWGDITLLDIDPLRVGSTRAEQLLAGKAVGTIVRGRVSYLSRELSR